MQAERIADSGVRTYRERDEGRDGVVEHWTVDEIRLAFIDSYDPEDGRVSGSFDQDHQSRAKLSARRLIGGTAK